MQPPTFPGRMVACASALQSMEGARVKMRTTNGEDNGTFWRDESLVAAAQIRADWRRLAHHGAPRRRMERAAFRY